ncbi:hypothetical protein [Streptomyces sp. NPDC046909]
MPKLAELVGMSPTVFSRTRRQVVEAGWLETQSSRVRAQLGQLYPYT